MIAAARIWHWLCAGSVVVMLAGAAPPDLVPDSLRVPPRPVPAAKTVLLAEDFKNLDAWQSDREGAWSVEQGVLCAHLPDEKQEHALLYAGSESWGDYAVDLDLYQVRGVDKGVLVRARGNQGVLVDLRGGEYQDVIVYRGRHPLGRAPAANVDGRWHHLRVVASGNRYAVYVDGKSVLECRDPLPGGRRGRIALPAYTGGKGMCVIFYANVTVTAAEGGR